MLVYQRVSTGGRGTRVCAKVEDSKFEQFSATKSCMPTFLDCLNHGFPSFQLIIPSPYYTKPPQITKTRVRLQ